MRSLSTLVSLNMFVALAVAAFFLFMMGVNPEGLDLQQNRALEGAALVFLGFASARVFALASDRKSEARSSEVEHLSHEIEFVRHEVSEIRAKLRG